MPEGSEQAPGDDSFDCIDGAVHSVYSTSATHPPDWILDRSAPVHAIYEYVDHIDPKISGDEGSIGKLTAHKRHAFEEGRYDFIVARVPLAVGMSPAGARPAVTMAMASWEGLNMAGGFEAARCRSDVA